MAMLDETMQILSQCDIGAVLLSDTRTILKANDAAIRLLHLAGDFRGMPLADTAETLSTDSPRKLYVNVAFGEYLTRCPAPVVEDLPKNTQLIAFRDATSDACHDMLISVLNQLKEAVVLCDAENRVYLLNNAAVELDSMVTEDVLGQSLYDAYEMLDGKDMAIPTVLREKRPIINHRQHYATRFGKVVNSLSNTFPIAQNGQMLGAFNILEDWTAVDQMQKQIMDLQEKLLTTAPGAKGKSALSAKYTFNDIMHTSPVMSKMLKTCAQAAKNDSSVMIYGETGTGKELLAQSIHNASQRANGPFLAINCAALPENLLEGLLFGTEKGAYTGAERRSGLFEQANGGTLLLDEINSMDISLQAKLLRVLQDGVVRRVGGMTEIRVDVRVISNINIPPYQAIAENKLRRDLYYRLGVVNIHIPPLRERKEDIALLSKHFVINYNKKLRKNVKNVSYETLEKFYQYSWPGNVRELQHAIEHAMNVLPDELSLIHPEHVPEHILGTMRMPAEHHILGPIRKETELQPDRPLNKTIKDMEYQSVCQALRDSGGNISEAARSLQMSRQNLQYRIKRYKIDVQALLSE